MDSIVNTLLHVLCKNEHQEIQIAFISRAEALLFGITDLTKHRNFSIYRHAVQTTLLMPILFSIVSLALSVWDLSGLTVKLTEHSHGSQVPTAHPCTLRVSTIFSGCWLDQPTFPLINYTEVLLHYFSSFNNWHPNASLKEFRLSYLIFCIPSPPASCGRVRDNNDFTCSPFLPVDSSG